jgi:hypothetical protein
MNFIDHFETDLIVPKSEKTKKTIILNKNRIGKFLHLSDDGLTVESTSGIIDEELTDSNVLYHFLIFFLCYVFLFLFTLILYVCMFVFKTIDSLFKQLNPIELMKTTLDILKFTSLIQGQEGTIFSHNINCHYLISLYSM